MPRSNDDYYYYYVEKSGLSIWTSIAASARKGSRPEDRTTRRDRGKAVDREDIVRQPFPRLSEDKTRGSRVFFELANLRGESERRGVAVTAIFQAPKRSLPVFFALALVLGATRTSGERFRALD